jgi:GH15 family glucan-1,4-alpha-glucosidase
MAESEVQAYRPIGEYAYISDCRSGALVSREGSIDWCCMPRLDAASVFGRLLDAERGGFCSIRPEADDAGVTRRYDGDSLVLETIFRGPSGEARLLDCFTIQPDERKPPCRQLLRVVEAIRGWLPFSLRVAARFDYGEVEPWLRRAGPNVWTAIGGNDGLLISCDVELDLADQPDLCASFRVHAGQRVRLSLEFVRPEQLDPLRTAPPVPEELDYRLNQTLAW